MAQEDLGIDGWAMEARLYAEDPAKGFLPSIGTLELLQFGESEGGRIDTGVYEGAEVSPFYDPMIAKVIAWGDDREEARKRLSDMLADSAESALLRLHPEDVPFVQGKLPATVFPVGDPHVQRGGFVIESASTIVEDGPDLWLEQLAQAIDRVPIPPVC